MTKTKKRRRDINATKSAAQKVTPPAGEITSGWARWWPCALIAGLVLWAFLPSLSNGFVTYDDQEYVTSNGRVLQGISLKGIIWAFQPTTWVGSNWHPLTLVSHMLDCQWYGNSAFGHHLTSLLLHAASSILLYVVLRRMTGAQWCSFAVAVWFGVHPAHVESVAWVSERKDVLSGFFWMLTLLAYSEYTKRQADHSPGRQTFYFLALAAFLLGLLAKPMLVTLPFVLLLIDFWPLRRLTLDRLRPLLLEKVPFFVLAVAASAITFYVQREAGAMGLAEEVPMGNRFANVAVSYLRYVGLLFWPTDLVAFYPLQKSWPTGLVVVAILFVSGIGVASLCLASKRGYWPVGWFWFFGTLVPVIGLVQVGSQSIADRYTYLPSIGLFIVVAWTVAEICGRWRIPAWSVGGLGALTVIACTIGTRQQVGFWRDGETLFRRVLSRYDQHYLPHMGLGTALTEKGRYTEAISELQRARDLEARVVPVYINLSAALLPAGRAEEALAACREAVRLAPQKNAAVWSNLGICQVETGDMAGAVESFRRATVIEPEVAEFQHRLGLALRFEGRFDEAIQAQNKALQLNPGMLLAREQAIKALILKGQLAQARMEWRLSCKLVANSVVEHNSFGVLLAEIGKIDAATQEFEAAQKIDPQNPDTKNNLARAYAARAAISDPKSPGVPARP